MGRRENCEQRLLFQGTFGRCHRYILPQLFQGVVVCKRAIVFFSSRSISSARFFADHDAFPNPMKRLRKIFQKSKRRCWRKRGRVMPPIEWPASAFAAFAAAATPPRPPHCPLFSSFLPLSSAATLGSSYYVDALWFGSLGYADVFWKTLSFQSGVFAAFAAATFLILYGSFLALKRAHRRRLAEQSHDFRRRAAGETAGRVHPAPHRDLASRWSSPPRLAPA